MLAFLEFKVDRRFAPGWTCKEGTADALTEKDLVEVAVETASVPDEVAGGIPRFIATENEDCSQVGLIGTHGVESENSE